MYTYVQVVCLIIWIKKLRLNVNISKYSQIRIILIISGYVHKNKYIMGKTEIQNGKKYAHWTVIDVSYDALDLGIA